MGKTRLEELCYELYGSSKQHDSWHRYAMVRELRELMKQPKASGSDHFERAGNDRMSGEIHEGLVHKAILEEKSTSQFQVSIAHSEIVRSISSGKVDLGLENEDYVVLKENLEQEGDQKNTKTKTDVDGDVERDQKMISNTNTGCAHKVLVKMPSKEKRIKHLKAWKFKFKPTSKRSKTMDVKFFYVEEIAWFTKDSKEINWGCVNKEFNETVAGCGKTGVDQFKLVHATPRPGVYDRPLQIRVWDCGGSLLECVWWRRLKHCQRYYHEMQAIEAENKSPETLGDHSFAPMKSCQSYAHEDDEMLEVARGVSKRSMLCLTFRIRESNAGEEQQTVYEQLKMVNEWQHQISLVLQQVMRSKKIRLSKRWWFKYRFDEEDQGSLQSRAGHSLSRREILTFISQAKAWWIQEVIAVTGFLLRRHLHLNLDCEEPKLAGQKRNHGLLIRLHSKQKQRKCPKSWMFKFKMDSEPARTRYLKSHKECGIGAQVRGAKKQSKLLLLSLCPSFICRAMLRVTVKRRKHSKTWSFKYKQQGNFRLLRCVGEGTRKDIVTVTSCRSYGLGKKFLLLNLEVKVSSKEGDLLQENGHGPQMGRA